MMSPCSADALREQEADTDEEGYSSFSDAEPDPGPVYLGGSAAGKLGGCNGARYSLRSGKNGSMANGRNGAAHGKNGVTGAAVAAAAAAAVLPDIGAMLKSISQVPCKQVARRGGTVPNPSRCPVLLQLMKCTKMCGVADIA